MELEDLFFFVFFFVLLPEEEEVFEDFFPPAFACVPRIGTIGSGKVATF